MLYLIVVGIIVFAVGVTAKKSNLTIRPYSGILKISGIGIILVVALLSSIVQINPGEIGVQ
jgi:hypothetical protein